MTTIQELRNMSIEDLQEYKKNLTIGFPKGFHEFTIFVVEKIIEEKENLTKHNSSFIQDCYTPCGFNSLIVNKCLKSLEEYNQCEGKIRSPK